ncbi:MAG: hypothetical protein IK133_09330 [Clostridia bacterium]|nr:hypothetical protein [Clostridia bacterium]
MNLESLHREVSETLAKLDFNRIWPGFEPLRFALYDDEKCFFGGQYIEKTDAFCANTSIVYNGEQIAIWMVSEELEIPVLTSKIVHEMFHGFQTLRKWDCWPNEIEALYRYEYNADNLSLKLRENALLSVLSEHPDEAALRELLSLRRLRSERHPYEFSYELRVEEIEGTANYVEWQVLKQLDAQKAAELTERMRAVMAKPGQLFPVRISCYYSGALMIHALLDAGIYPFDPPARPALLPLLKDAVSLDGHFPGRESCDQAVSGALRTFTEESESIVRSALSKNDIVLKGPLGLVYVNIYNARCWNGYLTSTYFLMYRDSDGDKMIPGNFVIRMLDEKTIDTVYRWE